MKSLSPALSTTLRTNGLLRSLLTILSALACITAQAQWTSDTTVNTSVSLAANSQTSPDIAPDGAGGAIIAWSDNRSSAYDIYVQHVDVNGISLWTPDGIAVCTEANDQGDVRIIPDDAGGAFLAWTDRRTGAADIYAQHIDANGTSLWTPGGVLVSGAGGDQTMPMLCSDGAGGIFLAWNDTRNNIFADIYAQRILADGSHYAPWGANNKPVAVAANNQTLGGMIPNGSGGVILAWTDERNYTFNGSDIYGQLFDSFGTEQWASNGYGFNQATMDQANPRIVTNGAGGAIVTWEDYRNGYSNPDIYAQNMLVGGWSGWYYLGVAVCAASSYQIQPSIAADGANGAIISWSDYRSGTGDIYAQRINTTGTMVWGTANGTPLCTATSDQYSSSVLSDGSGECMVYWIDTRNGNEDVYAQRMNGTGGSFWLTDGRAISVATGNQYAARAVSDSHGGALFTWSDMRDDLYAQNICAAGYAGMVTPVLSATISGPSLVCEGASAVYSVNDINGASYTWMLPAGWSGSSSTDSISAGSGSNGGTVSVLATNGCGTSATVYATLAINYPPDAAGAISGPDTICAGVDTSYSLATVGGATYYTWLLPTGWTGTSTSNVITAHASMANGLIRVIPGNACGITDTASIAITVNTVPDAAGTISGADTVCAGTSSAYAILPVAGAMGYTWLMPTGWNGSSLTSAITLTAGTGSGLVRVTPFNACGSSDTSTLAVTANTIAQTPAAILGAVSVCEGSNHVYNLAPVSNADSYNWILPNGWTGTSTDDLILVTMNSMSGALQVSAVNACGISDTILLNITVNTFPLVSTTQNDTSITADQSGAQYQWLDCNNGNAIIVGAIVQSYIATMNGNYAVAINNNGCVDTSACVSINAIGLKTINHDNLQLLIFPNPNTGSFSISAAAEGRYTISNALGQTVYSIELNAGNNYKASLEGLSTGVYYVNGNNTKHKVVVTQ